MAKKAPSPTKAQPLSFDFAAIDKEINSLGGFVPIEALDGSIYLDTGLTLLNAMLRPSLAESVYQGGWMASRSAEISGEALTGKSLLCYKAIANAQALNGGGMLIDTENRFSRQLFRLHGGNTKANFRLYRPATLDRALQIIDQYVSEYLTYAERAYKSGAPTTPLVIALDSIAQIGTESAADVKLKDGKMAQLPMSAASFWADFYRKPWLRQMGMIPGSQLYFLTTNQLRSGMATSSFLPPAPTTPGGAIHKYSSTIRIRSSSMKLRETDSKGERKDAPLGVSLKFKTLKCDGAPFRHVIVPYTYHEGLDDDLCCLHYLTDNGYLPYSGGRVTIGGKKAPKDAWKNEMRRNPSFRKDIQTMAYDAFSDECYYVAGDPEEIPPESISEEDELESAPED